MVVVEMCIVHAQRLKHSFCAEFSECLSRDAFDHNCQERKPRV